MQIEGATEVRIAGRAFQAMRHRINKQITERTSLLAGVSHDLKTPLTRMRLQLAVMVEKKEIKEDFEKELIELEEMIDGYLEFARNEREEHMVEASLFKIIQQLQNHQILVKRKYIYIHLMLKYLYSQFK